MMHKNLQGMGFLGTVKGAIVDVPDDSYTVPLDRANIVREGADITIVGLGATVHIALDAAALLAGEGIDAEIVDLRSLAPLDRNTICRSVGKTGRLVVVDDDYLSCGVTAEVIASVVERDLAALKAPPRRVAHPDVPIPYARPMEQFCLPNATKVVDAVRAIMSSAK